MVMGREEDFIGLDSLLYQLLFASFSLARASFCFPLVVSPGGVEVIGVVVVADSPGNDGAVVTFASLSEK